MPSKQSDLLRLPLWECPECGRLEFSESRLTCPCGDNTALMDSVTKGAIYTCEAIAQHFYRDTGFLRIGKDDCRGVHTDEEREAAFRKWDQGTLQ